MIVLKIDCFCKSPASGQISKASRSGHRAEIGGYQYEMLEGDLLPSTALTGCAFWKCQSLTFMVLMACVFGSLSREQDVDTS